MLRRRWHWQEWSAIAATLVVGILLAPLVMRASQPLPFINASGRVVAIRELDNALMHQVAGTGADAHIAIGSSFRAGNGEYCRTFAINPGPAGLACREWGEWVVELLARNPRARQGVEPYREAGIALPDVLRQAVESRRSGEVLTAAEETAASAHGWRPGKP